MDPKIAPGSTGANPVQARDLDPASTIAIRVAASTVFGDYRMEIEKKSLSVEVGQTFSVSLESMPGSTGYDWALSGLTGEVVLVSIDVQQHMSGTCGHVVHTYTFLAKKIGDAKVGFELLRPWIPGEPGREVVYGVKVVAGAAATDEVKAALKEQNLHCVVGSSTAAVQACAPVQALGGVHILKYGILPFSGMKYGVLPNQGVVQPLYGIMPQSGCC